MSYIRARVKNGRWQLSRISTESARFINMRTQREVERRDRRELGAGALPIDAESVPPELRKRYEYTEDELAYIERKICAPARLRRAAKEAAAEAKAVDPVWRINEAVRLLEEVVSSCSEEAISTVHSQLDLLQNIVGKVRSHFTVENTDSTSWLVSLVANACESLAKATALLDTPAIPKAQDTAIRQAVNRCWQGLATERSQLQLALQRKGYVATRANSEVVKKGG